MELQFIFVETNYNSLPCCSKVITKDQHALGTADYSAPEVILGYQLDGRADSFSIAVIAFEMLAGELPFKGQLIKCHTRQDFLKLEYVCVHKLNPMVP
ncbi:protein kinase domain-containing protein [Shewanella aestuarii]|uniref:Protein kinase domain-containing protein n=1 Tax=Shewanella aestuarii TaxID=1028752 RepID=A0A6G9QJG7_9GAMM|nr:hypothetical protein [Shewanella aestuarii]QIR14283.1 hypothetical protein HBH39_07105 [Shewanella aestuarii]